MENFSLQLAVERFSDVMWAMQQLLFLGMDQRLAIFLLDEASKTGSPIVKITHEKIAKHTGSAREVVHSYAETIRGRWFGILGPRDCSPRKYSRTKKIIAP